MTTSDGASEHFKSARHEFTAGFRTLWSSLGRTVSNGIGLPIPEVEHRAFNMITVEDGDLHLVPINTFTLPERGSRTQETIKRLCGLFKHVELPPYDDLEPYSAENMATDMSEIDIEGNHITVTGELRPDYKNHITGELRQRGLVFIGSTALFKEVSQ